ncbi:non-ribosomal peptide synthetase [Fibrella aquatilis]|uniref:Amino acid adenylation domain-containing protein n=1 Tax=Fibrella aquatilis TaxID=2817059 RepID=A0A939JZJ1_9BACT|nr:non-ribosomal peptide synthetase [Fibrella aquatilis]MBO0931463.1 amino acid adenylation domain-containing protein [Fibrella aquatilis]
MTIPELIHALRAAQIQVRVVNDRLALQPATGIPPALLDAVRTHKTALIDFLRAAQTGGTPTIVPVARQAHYPLSSAQRRMWILDQYPGARQAYNIIGAYQLSGRLHVAALAAALTGVVARHESLRTTFLVVDGEPRQQVADHGIAALEQVDLPNPNALPDWLQTEAQRAFDLEKGPLLRVTLLRQQLNEHLLVLTLHHIIADGTSVEVLMRELSALYNTQIGAAAQPLPPLPIHYKDYAHWQLGGLTSPGQAQHKQYWQQTFADGTPVLELPTDFPKARGRTFRGASLKMPVDAGIVSNFNALCISHEASFFMGLLATLNVLLYRYTGQTDLVVGTPVAGREQTELQNQIGFYINTLALRTQLDGAEDFATILHRVRTNTLAAFAHQNYPFDVLLDDLTATATGPLPALFDVMLMYQRFTEPTAETALSGLVVTDYFLDNQTSKFDLTISVFESVAGVELLVNYNTDRFSEPRIRRLMDHFQGLMQQVVCHPRRPVCELDYLTDHERHHLLVAVNQTDANYPHHQTVGALFDAQVLATPNHTALVFEHNRLTYKELNERANQLAHYLRSVHGVGPEDHVAMLMDRSEYLVVALLGVLKAGAAYVPIDPDYPTERIGFTLHDAAAVAVITNGSLPPATAACVPDGCAVVDLQPWAQTLAGQPTHNPVAVNQPADLAYIIYTSGSTGQPKGVLVEHRNVVRLFVNDRPLFDFNANDVWVLFHSVCFDFSVWEIFGALLFGGKLVVAPRHTVQDPARLVDLLVAEGVTVLNQVPTLFGLVAQEVLGRAELPPLLLRYVIFGGEALTPATLVGWHEQYPQVALVNMYGITETTVHVTYKRIGPADMAAGISNIGTPIPTLKVYLMDAQRQLVPVGVVGELMVGGAGVSRGYLNRPALTAERFIENPYVSGERLYASGDLGKWQDDGSLVYMSRRDNQVKIRGYRIELSEIDHACLAFADLSDVRTLLHTEPSGQKLLVAYVVPRPDFLPTNLKTFLHKKLPDHMQPDRIICLERFPVTVNGKIDTKSFPPPVTQPVAFLPTQHLFRNDEERVVMQLFQEVIPGQLFGLGDNLFDAGFNSLSVIESVRLLHRAFPAVVQIQDVFSYPSVRQLADLIRQRTTPAKAPSEAITVYDL